MNRIILCMIAALICISGCNNHHPVPYGEEDQTLLPGERQLVVAVAPTINFSGEAGVDPLLHSDLLFQQLQEVHGMKVLPVDRVVEVYAALRIDKVQDENQAFSVCDLLGCDGLLIPSISAYDPYDPPKVAGSLQLFLKPGTYRGVQLIDPHALIRAANPGPTQTSMRPEWLIQATGMFDASDGTVRDRVDEFSKGRVNPNSPLGNREMYKNMDKYCAFVDHELIGDLLDQLRPQMTADASH